MISSFSWKPVCPVALQASVFSRPSRWFSTPHCPPDSHPSSSASQGQKGQRWGVTFSWDSQSSPILHPSLHFRESGDWGQRGSPPQEPILSTPSVLCLPIFSLYFFLKHLVCFVIFALSTYILVSLSFEKSESLSQFCLPFNLVFYLLVSLPCEASWKSPYGGLYFLTSPQPPTGELSSVTMWTLLILAKVMGDLLDTKSLAYFPSSSSRCLAVLIASSPSKFIFGLLWLLFFFFFL